jgi:hypothetical protein
MSASCRSRLSASSIRGRTAVASSSAEVSGAGGTGAGAWPASAAAEAPASGTSGLAALSGLGTVAPLLSLVLPGSGERGSKPMRASSS